MSPFRFVPDPQALRQTLRVQIPLLNESENVSAPLIGLQKTRLDFDALDGPSNLREKASSSWFAILLDKEFLPNGASIKHVGGATNASPFRSRFLLS